MIGVSREIEYDLRNDMFRHLESLSYSHYQKNRTGDIMARATNDLNAVRMLLGPAIMYSANTLVFTAVALVFMWHISPRLTLYAFAPLPIASVVVQYIGRKIHERFEKIQAQFSDISARAQENFSGARVVRAYAQEEAEIALFETSNQEYVTRSLPLARLTGMLWPTLELLLGFALVLVLWLGGREVLMGRISLGDFVAFNTYIVMLTWPIIALGWVINIFQRGTASMGRINEILVAQPEITDALVAPDLKHTTALRGEIEFRHLDFSYDGVPVLKDVNLKVSAGSSLAIVGPTGSGKTTLVSLLPRIYDAAPGSLLIDGRPIREYPLETLRQNIGFVPQETFLFSDTVRENIAFGVETATDEQVATRRRSRQHRRRHRRLPRRLRHACRRARHHSLRRAETAQRHCPRHHPRPAHPGAGRRALQRGYLHGRKNPGPPAPGHAWPHHDLYLAPRLHRPQC